MKNILVALVLATLILSGCAAVPPEVREIKVPVPVPCMISAPSKPSMPIDAISKYENNVFTIVKNLLAEIELRKGYETVLESAIASCNK